MTCDEIQQQINLLRQQFATLSGVITSQQAAINSAFAAAITGDIYGGTYPTAPPTIAGLQARIAFLNSLNPQPVATINAYGAIIGQVQQLEGTQAAQAQTVVMLGGMIQTGIDQGCQLT